MSLSSTGPGPREFAGHAGWLHRRAVELVHSEDLARDLVQDTFVAYLNRPPAIDHSLRGWLEAVMRNHYRMWCRAGVRRGRRENAVYELDSARDVDSPDASLDRARLTRWMRDEIEQIQEPYQTALRLRYYEGLRPSQIAERLKLPQSTVRRRCMVGLQMLRVRMTSRFGGQETLMEATLMRAFAPVPVGFGEKWRRGLRNLTRPAFSTGVLATVAAVGVLVFLPAGGERDRSGHALPAPRLPTGIPEFGPTGWFEDSTTETGASRPVRSNGADPGTRPERNPDGDLASAASANATGKEPGETAEPPKLSCGSLQKRIDGAGPGSTLRVPGCVFRESVVIDKPLSLIADPGAEIRGSDVFTGWHPHDGLWVSHERVPEHPGSRCTPTPAGDNSDDQVCWTFEQVFVDGRRLAPAAHGERPLAGQFALTADRRVLLASDPAQHSIEVTTRPAWMRIDASDVTVSGFTMAHATGGPMRAAFFVSSFAGRARIEGNVFRHSSGYGVDLGGSDHVFVRNDISYSGGAALRVRPSERVTIENNVLHHNGMGHRRDNGWVTGGMSILITKATIVANVIRDNEGTGITLVGCHDAQVSGNRISNNSAAGIIALRSDRSEVTHNTLLRNGSGFSHPAMFVTQSSTLHVAENTFAFHPRGIEVNVLEYDELPAGFRTCEASSNNRLEANVFVASGELGVDMTGDPRAVHLLPPCASNQATGNRVWTPEVIGRTGDRAAFLSDVEKEAVLASITVSDMAPRE